MDFVPVIFFVFLYYIRPHDWMPGLTALKPMTLTMAWALMTMFGRPGGFRPRELVATPHQQAMLLFLAWIVFAAVDLSGTMESLKSGFIFFAVTALALNTPERMEKYLRAWMWALLIIAAIAVLSLVGFDPTGAKDATEATK